MSLCYIQIIMRKNTTNYINKETSPRLNPVTKIVKSIESVNIERSLHRDTQTLLSLSIRELISLIFDMFMFQTSYA